MIDYLNRLLRKNYEYPETLGEIIKIFFNYMEQIKKEKREPEESRVDMAKDAISSGAEGIKAEFQRTKNSWLACFGGRLDAIETYLSSEKAKNEFETEEYNAVQEKLETLKRRVNNLKQQYPNRNTVPPDEIKQELLDMLDVLK